MQVFYSEKIISYVVGIMQRFSLYYSQDWYVHLPNWQKELVRTSLELYAREERLQSAFEDYSFIVFPAAKAYEGFLKEFFYQAGFIAEHTYNDKRFRIGRALNPDLNPNHQDDLWLYPRIVQECGLSVARTLWETWLECRNKIFHYFPSNERRLSLLDSGKCIEMIVTAIEESNKCQLQSPH
jgi:hypothetical protein